MTSKLLVALAACLAAAIAEARITEIGVQRVEPFADGASFGASGAYERVSGVAKGELDPGEELETTARRETLEETGVIAGDLMPLGHITYQKSRKQVHAFAGPAPDDCQPRCASWEIDQARFVSLEEARRIIHPDQAPFLDRLLAHLQS